jgi:hypothetical protein
MRLRTFIIILIGLGLFPSCHNKNGGESAAQIDFINRQTEKKLDVLVDGKLFTSFCWPDSVYKPILFPVYTSAGTVITRGFPLDPRPGERFDHIHQTGIWLNYGNVNGIDFWGNGYRNMKEPDGGVIKHIRIERLSSSNGEGYFVSDEKWLGPDGNRILDEKSEYNFSARGSIRIIDRITTLKAGDTAVLFKDTKEGFFAIRLARQLELPSGEGVDLLGADGKPSEEMDSLNIGVTGNYISSEGITGEKVWGTRARWMNLTGKIGNEQVSIVMFDHPKNPGYPAYWHARGYGLFALNPFGWHDFTKGEKEFNFTIPAKKMAKFRYRILINSGSFLTPVEINQFAEEFRKKYK